MLYVAIDIISGGCIIASLYSIRQTYKINKEVREMRRH